jgi:hypothetical protein
LPQRSGRHRVDPEAGFWFLHGTRDGGGRTIEFHSEDLSMTSMKDREDGFERKFAFDEELRFKATARRNKLFGLWAAGKLGKTGDDAEAYAKQVVIADFQEAGDEDVIGKVKADFGAAGVDQSDHQIRRSLEEFMATAIEQIRNAP